MINRIKIFPVFLALFTLVTVSCKDKNDDDGGKVEPDLCENVSISLSANYENEKIIVAASGGEAPYTYSIDGVSYGMSSEFSPITPGDYTLYVKDKNECTSSTTITVAEPQPTTITDSRDDQTYKIVKIGTQTWMAENLNYKTESGSYCYDDDDQNCATYGRLYTWETAKTACPTGYHLPSDDEWNTLKSYIDEQSLDLSVDGNSGFEALLSGYGSGGSDPKYLQESEAGIFWTSSEAPGVEGQSITYYISVFSEGLSQVSNKTDASLSVRCIAD